jgi:gliding-associated putative ABC transporter substrate-binding component GldG
MWIIGIIFMINLLSRDFFVRMDATEDNMYTLSPATKNILNNLEEPVTVSAYFTKGLPPQYNKTLTDFEDLLKEYSTRSGGLVNYEFFNPNENEELEQQAVQNGIQPLLINAREKDEVVQKKAYMGATITQGEQVDLIPFISPGSPMEYNLTTSIKKVSVAEKPSIGIVQGHGEPAFNQIGQIYQSLSILYDIEEVKLDNPIPTRLRTVLLLNPVDSILDEAFNILDQYLESGGKLCIAFNAVQGNFQTVQGEAVNNGVSGWLASKGVNVTNGFVLDASCGSIGVQQKQGFFTVNSQVEFPYFPRVTSFPEHPITQGIDQIVFPFASPINFSGDSLLRFTSILETSANSAIQNLPVYFDVQRKWNSSDFPMGATTLGAVIEGDFGNNGINAQMVVFTDGDFPIAEGASKANADNFNLLVNAIDWLSDDTGLIDLRTKGVASRPIEEIEDGKKSTLKWLNFLLPLALVLAFGLYRNRKNKIIRNRRMQESYS